MTMYTYKQYITVVKELVNETINVFACNGLKLKSSFVGTFTSGIRAFLRLYIRGGAKGNAWQHELKIRANSCQYIGWLRYMLQGDYTSCTTEYSGVSREIPALVIKISRFKKSFRDCLRVYKRIESFQKYKQGLRRANREKAKHLISGNLEREGDNLTATADHNVVAHMLKSIAEKNCLYFTCYIRVLLKGLVMGQSPSTPSRDS